MRARLLVQVKAYTDNRDKFNEDKEDARELKLVMR